MAKKKKSSKPTLRQRLRAKAAQQLAELEERTKEAILLQRKGAVYSVEDMARLVAGGNTKTLREKLVTAMTNELESELEALFNRQENLPLGDDNA